MQKPQTYYDFILTDVLSQTIFLGHSSPLTFDVDFSAEREKELGLLVIQLSGQTWSNIPMFELRNNDVSKFNIGI